MGWVILIVVVLLIFLAIHYWWATLTLSVIWFAVYLVLEDRKLRKQRREEEAAQARAKAADEAAKAAARAAEVKRHTEEQRLLLEQVNALSEKSLRLLELMPQQLDSAQRYLDRAEADFADSAFAPFWDSIENAAKDLGYFNEAIFRIKENYCEHGRLARAYESPIPKFPIANGSITKLDVGTAIAERMKKTVRTAQRNFQFATIYEHRKTNQILVAGFSSMGQALDEMGSRIADSICELGESIEATTSASTEAITSAVTSGLDEINSRSAAEAETAEQYRDERMRQSSAASNRERKVIAMLDNIQRHRKPTLFDA